MGKRGATATPVISDTKAPIVMALTRDGGTIATRVFGASHNLTNEELLGMLGMLAASVIMPAIEEHGYDADMVPMSLELIKDGMEATFLDKLGGRLATGPRLYKS